MFKNLKFIDHTVLLSALILTALGIIVIYSISFGSGAKIYFLQLIYAILGLMLFFVFTFLDYRLLKGAAVILYFAGLLLLIIVLIFGRSGSAARWLNLGLFYFQPAEIFKVVAIVYFSAFLCDKEELYLRDIIVYIFAAALPIVLIAIQPDLGTAIVVFLIAAVILVVSKIKKIYLAILSLAAAFLLPLVYSFLHDYQKERIKTFLNPVSDPWGAGYNVLQSKIAIGSGRLFGRGLGHGSQSQLNFLPAQHTDFIFAAIAEELGFVGSMLVLGLFFLLAFRIVKIAKIARDNFGKFLAMGILSMIVFQVFINIGMNLGLMPVTGIPLPLVSFGGSSLLSTFIALGILESIYLRHRKLSFEQ